MTDEEQLNQFEKAVEEKKRKAEEASHGRLPQNPNEGEIHGDEPDIYDDSRPPDELSPRAKSTQHRKMTADKWNQ
ncbi:MAG TPA: hypothetical protein VF752_00905 [Thermoleophilaceae bacterium]